MEALREASDEVRAASAVLEQARASTLAALKQLAHAREEMRAHWLLAEACHETEQRALGDLVAALTRARLAYEMRHDS